VTSTLAFDLRPPQSPAWGQAQLFVSVPSRNLYNAPCGQVPLAGSQAGVYRPVSFTLPSAVMDALRTSYNDLTFMISLNVPYTTSSYLLDNLHFVGSVANSKVEVRVSSVDDFVTASVDGLLKRTWHIGDPVQNERVDVSNWFSSGTHQVRFQGINTGGPTSFNVELWVDDQPIVNQGCPSATCNGMDAPEGILWDTTFSVATPNRPASRSVQVTSATPGKLYIDDSYTGLTTPATLSLPQGQYALGLGVSLDQPLNYTGHYYEQSAEVGPSTTQLTIDSTQALPVQRTTSITILPIRNSYVLPATDAGVLQDSDVTLLQSQAEATRTLWLEPLSYGLATWNLSVQPMVENVPLYLPNSESPPDADTMLQQAGLTGLLQQYDMVVYYYSMHRPDGSTVSNPTYYAWGGGGQYMAITTFFTRGAPPTAPNAGFLHESLHNYEAYNEWERHRYNGVGGLHGAGQHGYPESAPTGETDWLMWYRYFMRGQVAQLDGMRVDVTWPSIPTTSDLYVGVFPSMRHGAGAAQMAGMSATSELGATTPAAPASAAKPAKPRLHRDARSFFRSVR
jgi:hypothetical protein